MIIEKLKRKFNKLNPCSFFKDLQRTKSNSFHFQVAVQKQVIMSVDRMYPIYKEAAQKVVTCPSSLVTCLISPETISWEFSRVGQNSGKSEKSDDKH